MIFLVSKKSEDRLILDRDVEEEEKRLRLHGNPLDNAEISSFTLESELQRLSNQLQENGGKFLPDMKADAAEIRKLMNQAEEDRTKLSERGIIAFDYLESKKEFWNE